MSGRRSRHTPGPMVPPSLPAHRAIPLLNQQISRLDAVKQLRHDHPEVSNWETTTRGILDATFGHPQGEMSEQAMAVVYAQAGPLHVGMTDYELQREHEAQQEKRRALLRSYVEQLETLMPPSARVSPGGYRFHPEIERVSGDLYRDGHYKQAALEAYIRVISAVRERSGLDEDGDSLMNHAFGCDGRTPVIQFNSLQTDEERDEQRGFMFLYKGMVGLRNSKAHSNRLIDDPNRAHEYLALASLLLNALELARINRSAT